MIEKMEITQNVPATLAIIVPYYRLNFFEEMLGSLARQTEKRFHVYIGNDASGDSPDQLLETFTDKIDFTYRKFDTNMGTKSLTKQWDRCIAMMNEEKWFMVLGDDDYLEANVVEEFYKNINIAEKENINVIKLNSAIIDESSKVLSEKKPEPYIKSSIEHFFDKYINEGRSSLSEHIFKKTAYEQYGFADMPFAWHSDDLALLEFSEYGRILFLQNAKCFVRVSSQSISGNPAENKKEKWAATKIFFDEICKNLNRFQTSEKSKLFDLIEWHEKEKNIKIYIPRKISEFYRVFGWQGIFKAIL